MTAGFVIRFHYSENDPRFMWRFNFFKTRVLPRLQKQSETGFEIYVWSNPAHDKLFHELNCKTFHAPDKRRYKNGYFHDFVSFEELEGFPKLELQMGLDSDDFIMPDYVKIIFDFVKLHKAKFPEQSFHICFQPRLFDLKTKVKTNMRRYNTRKGSAFMALYQPVRLPYRFIYSESHISIITKADQKQVIGPGFCYAVKHNINESTGRTINEIKNNKIILV